MDVTSALDRLRERIEAAASRAGRSAAEIELIAVTKGFGPEVAGAALAAGLNQLGESRVQEARVKIPVVHEAHPAARPTWHLIGHLQTNKAGQAAGLFDWVHSVDSLKLAEALSARRQGAPLAVLAQIKSSTEPTKTGIAVEEALEVAPAIARLPNLELRGLMTIPAHDPDPRVARDAFRALRELADRLRTLDETRSCMEHLSMGMSGDFEIAIEEGATMIRLGTALFGPRPTHLKA